MCVRSLFLAMVLLSPAWPTPVAHAQDAAALLQKSAPSRAPRNSIQTVTMRSYPRQGAPQERQMTLWVRAEGGDLLTLTRVDTPADVAGTMFLSLQPKGKAAEQFIYLPKLGKSSRVMARRASLLGSDFSASDMDFSGWESAQARLLGQRQVEIGGQKLSADVVELTPPAGASPYDRATLYLAADGFPRRIEFQEKDGKVVKRWDILEVQTLSGVMVPTRSVMESPDRGTRTELVLSQVRLNVPSSEVPAEMFTTSWMEGKRQGGGAP